MKMTKNLPSIKWVGNLLLLSALLSNVGQAKLVVESTKTDLTKDYSNPEIWTKAIEESVTLMGQPMVAPRPKETTTTNLKVQAVTDGQRIAFRLRWADSEVSEGGKLGTFSDAVALQFPIKDNKNPPPIFMGGKDNPVHIFHWRAQYQKDAEQGKPTVKDIYPNTNPDIYPLEFKDSGKIAGLNNEKQEVFAPGKAAGNPQSYAKKAVDELTAEGFGSSTVLESNESLGHGEWVNGEWSVVISRPLQRPNGSVLKAGEDSFVAFAVWQGGKDEVGSRKSLTMVWLPLEIKN